MNFKVLIDRARCKGCGFCVAACEKLRLRKSGDLNEKGYHFVELCGNNGCDGCRKCVDMCPDGSIDILKVESEKAPQPAQPCEEGK